MKNGRVSHMGILSTTNKELSCSGYVIMKELSKPLNSCEQLRTSKSSLNY